VGWHNTMVHPVITQTEMQDMRHCTFKVQIVVVVVVVVVAVVSFGFGRASLLLFYETHVITLA